MKRNNIIIGSVSVIAFVATMAVSPWKIFNNEGDYAQNGLPSLEAKSAEDARKWMEARYIDEATGERISPAKLEAIMKQILKAPRNKNISFMEQGPDNIGGRTRAIQVDRSDRNLVFAGGVSGGLFKTINRADTWSRVDSYIAAGASPFISSMCMTPDGVLFVATGSNQEGGNGNGVWYSTDKGQTWAVIPGTSNSTEIGCSDVVTDNYVWMATTSGLKKWKMGDASITAVPVGSGVCNTIQVSKDSQVLVAAVGSNKTWVSNDGGSTWADKSGTGAGLVPTGSGRIEYAISPTKLNGSYTVYASRTNGNLIGMNISLDNGQTWSQFVGASGTPSNLDIYRDQGTYNSIISVDPTDPKRLLIGGIDIWQWKMTVNNPPSGGFEPLTLWFTPPYTPKYAHADNHEMKWDDLNRLYIGNDGGIGITDDLGANWFPSNRGYNVTQFYGIAFDRDGAVMGGAQDNGTLYNDHTLSTFQEFREVGGGDGFECEISFFNPRIMFSSVYYNSISRSGDKGQTFTSFVPTLPGTYDPCGTDGSPFHPFHTEFVLAEYYDLASKDSVTYIPTKDYPTGSSLSIPSASTGDSMTYVSTAPITFDDTLFYSSSLTVTDVSIVNAINGQTVYLGNFSWAPFASASGSVPPIVGDSLLVQFPTGADTVVVGSLGTYTHYYGENSATGEVLSLGIDTVAYNVAWDTLRIQDPYQSWFVVYVNANGGELWGTRNALRLAAADQMWVNIARNIGGGLFNNIDIEFSRNLEHCYISAGAGVYRIDGLGSSYTSDPNFESKVGWLGTPIATPPTYTTKTQITTSNYQGIAVNPNNKNDIVCFAGFGGVTRRSLNATSATPTFTALSAITTPSNVAVYDGIIDRDDSDILVVGTASGVFVTEDGGATWSNASAGFEGTPVYEVRQSWRTWDEGNRRPGEIYIGSFGRGIWSTAAYLGIGDADGNGNQIFKTKLKTYPNPTTEMTTLTFNLDQSSNVNVMVYNISGILVQTINNKNMPAGSQTLKIDASDLPRGTYIVKLVAGKQNDTVKFIKM